MAEAARGRDGVCASANGIRYDVQAAYLGSEPKTDLIRAAGRMSRLMDPRRPKKLNNTQRATILSQSGIQQLLFTQQGLYNKIRKAFKFIYKAEGEAVHEDYRRARLQLYAAIRSQERAKLAQIQDEYDATVPLQDMLEQINGNTKPINAEFRLGEISYSFPERFRIAKAFFDSKIAISSGTDSRAAFVNDLISLCTRLETRVHTRKRKFVHELDNITQDCIDSSIEFPLVTGSPAPKAARVEIKPAGSFIPTKCEPFQCLVCLGNARLSRQDRLHNYGSRDSLKRHFHRKYKAFECDLPCPHPDPQCATIFFASEAHFLNHAATIHGIFMDSRTWLK